MDDRIQYRNVVGGGDTEQKKVGGRGRCRDGEDGCREGGVGGMKRPKSVKLLLLLLLFGIKRSIYVHICLALKT